jgi:hypothetical protein
MRVSKSLVARVGTVVAAAAIAVSGVAAASASTAPQAKVKTPTTLVATAGPGHVRHHRYPHTVAWIKGHLTSNTTPAGEVSGARVFLKREGRKGHWFVVQIGRTGRFGNVRFRVHALRKGASFELVFRGNRNFAASKSNVITIAPVTSK